MSRTGQSTYRVCQVLLVLKRTDAAISIREINDQLLQVFGIDVCYATTWHDLKHMSRSGIVKEQRVTKSSRNWVFSLSEEWK